MSLTMTDCRRVPNPGEAGPSELREILSRLENGRLPMSYPTIFGEKTEAFALIPGTRDFQVIVESIRRVLAS